MLVMYNENGNLSLDQELYLHAEVDKNGNHPYDDICPFRITNNCLLGIEDTIEEIPICFQHDFFVSMHPGDMGILIDPTVKHPVYEKNSHWFGVVFHSIEYKPDTVFILKVDMSDIGNPKSMQCYKLIWYLENNEGIEYWAGATLETKPYVEGKNWKEYLRDVETSSRKSQWRTDSQMQWTTGCVGNASHS